MNKTWGTGKRTRGRGDAERVFVKFHRFTFMSSFPASPFGFGSDAPSSLPLALTQPTETARTATASPRLPVSASSSLLGI
ncbi:MAG: hypothetical protein RM338_11970 [Nostoc sp. DedQUE12a]|nr:hypothetical protein [Nostoc sp. DedQUE12a]